MTILIENLTFDAIIGILEAERTTLQKVNVECIIDYTYSDGNFINYADVVNLIESTIKREKFELIETAIETIASSLKADFPRIQTLTLMIRKPEIISNCTVGIQKKFFF